MIKSSHICTRVCGRPSCPGKTNVLSKEDWWQLLVSCVLTLCDVRRYEEAELLVESAMEFYSFYDNKPRRKEMECFGLSATILDLNHYKAYNYIRWARSVRSVRRGTGRSPWVVLGRLLETTA